MGINSKIENGKSENGKLEKLVQNGKADKDHVIYVGIGWISSEYPLNITYWILSRLF